MDDEDNRTTLSDDTDDEPLIRRSLPSGIMSTRDEASNFAAHGSPPAVNWKARAPGNGRNIATGCLGDERVQDFLEFADWAFSGEGLSNLQILAWGDFSYEGRYTRYNLLLCKAENGYRTLTKADVKYWDLVHD